MLRFLWKVIVGGCDHDWETLRSGYLFTEQSFNPDGSAYGGKTTGTAWLYRCKKCCKSKQIRSIT